MTRGIGRTVVSLGFGLVGGYLGGMLLGGIGYGLGYLGGSFIGSLIFPAESQNDMPPMSKYPVQNASKGMAVPVMYGTARMAGNVIWMGELQTYEVEQGGKGGGAEVSSTMYRRSFCLAICEGERHILRAWQGKDQITIGVSYSTSGATFTPAYPGKWIYESSMQELTVFTGDGYNYGLADLIGEDYADYRDVLCVFFDSWDLGPADMLPNFTFEVSQDVPVGLIVGANGMAFLLSTDYKVIGILTTSLYQKSLDYDPNYSRWINTTQIAQGVLQLYSQDGTEIERDWEQPAAGGNPRDVRFSPDGLYAYVLIIQPTHLYKYRLSDGAIVWDVSLVTDDMWSPFSPTLAVDSLDNIYVQDVQMPWFGDAYTAVFDSDGNFLRSFSQVEFNYGRASAIHETGIAVDPLTGELRVTGQLYSTSTTDKYAGEDRWPLGLITDLLTGDTQEVDFGAEFGDTCNHCCWARDAWFALTSAIDGKALWRIDTNGNVISGVAPPANASGWYGICRGPGSSILVWGASSDPVSSKYIWLYDTDLNLIAEYDATNPDYPTGYGFDPNPIYPSQSKWGVGGGGGDANPADIIYDIWSNTRYGAKTPAAYIDDESFESVRQYCADNDLLISPVLSSARPALDWVQYICSHFGGFLYWMGGKVYLGAWRGETAEIHITQDDLVTDGEGPPVQCEKRKYSESRNHIEVAWLSREDIYGPAVTPAKDDVDIRVSGKVRKQQIELGGVTRAVLAQKMAYRYLIDSMYRFTTYSFVVGYKKSLLRPGQVCLLSDGFKISNQRVRIVSINEAKDGANLAIEAVDDISDLYPDIGWTPEVTKRTADTVVGTSDLGDPVVSFREDWHANRIYVSVAPTTAYCSGWHIYVSRDGATYAYMETVRISAVTGGSANSAGTLLEALPAAKAPTWRGDESVLVDIGTVTDLHTDITDEQFFGGLRLAKIGNEIVAYKTCEETATEGQWRITGLIRGLHQTEPVGHAIGETFRTLDVTYEADFDEADIGNTLYVKAVPYYRDVAASIASTDAAEVTVMGNYRRPFGAAAVRLTSDENDGGFRDYSGATLDLYWNLCAKTSGFNVGGQDGGGTWAYGDSEGLLVAQSGVAYAAYLQDPDLQGVDLVYRELDRTYIGETHLGVVSSATVTKATDLNGQNPAYIDVLPRHSMRATRVESAIVDDGS